MPGPLQAVAFLIAATILEVSGDAVIRIALYNHAGLTAARIGLFALGAALVFGYGTFLNLAPLEFGEVVGLYIATLFIVWQAINFAYFRPAICPASGAAVQWPRARMGVRKIGSKSNWRAASTLT